MFEGQSRRSVASSAHHRQEAEFATAEEHERAAAETAATATRLEMVELAATRAEVEAAAAADAAHAVTAELEALCASSTGSSVFADDDRDSELKLAREVAREQATQWAAVHPQGRRGSSPDGRGRAAGAPGGGARGGRAPDGDGSPDRRRHASGWVDRDRGLYRRRSSPSPDRYHGHYGIQAIVRDIGPNGGWPTLTKTNNVEWATVMRVRLQVRHMWEAVRYGDVDYYEDRRALDALIATVPPEMQFSLSKKQIAKKAWDAIAAAHIGSDHTCKTTLLALRKE
jgi:pyruvate/2-oxoglutarate dehydrogenase complex dihydrolipoamide acyltransferase (E2) component